MTNITPIKNNIIFSFNDRVNSQGQFEKETTAGGIILQASFDDSAKQPRWGTVVAVGPDCKVTVGSQILLPNLRWTAAFTVDGSKMWKTDESQVAATRVDASATVVPQPGYILFTRNRKAATKTTMGIIMVANPDDTPTGSVIAIGDGVYAELSTATILFNDTNFSDDFTVDGRTLSFIKEQDVIAYHL